MQITHKHDSKNYNFFMIFQNINSGSSIFVWGGVGGPSDQTKGISLMEHTGPGNKYTDSGRLKLHLKAL